MRLKPYQNKDGKRVWLSRDEIAQLIDQAEDTEQEIAFKLGVRCGLRRKEIVQITAGDLVTSEKNSVHLRVWEDVAKKGHYREPPVPDDLATQIGALIDFKDLDRDDCIVDRNDKTVYRWVRRAADRLEEETEDEGWSFLNVHDLRRSWGTHMLSEGVLPSVVMSWGGWRDWDVFREHYLGEFSPRVIERERQKVDFLASGETIESEPITHCVVPDSSSAKYVTD